MNDSCHQCGLRNPPSAQLLYQCQSIGCQNLTCTDPCCRALKLNGGHHEGQYVCSQCCDEHQSLVIKEAE